MSIAVDCLSETCLRGEYTLPYILPDVRNDDLEYFAKVSIRFGTFQEIHLDGACRRSDNTSQHPRLIPIAISSSHQPELKKRSKHPRNFPAFGQSEQRPADLCLVRSV